MIQVFKILNEIDNLDKNIFFKTNTLSTTRGHSQKLSKNHNRTNIRANAFSQRSVNIWNSLSEKCIQSSTVNNLKSNLNEHWKNHPQKFIYDLIACARNVSNCNAATRGQHYPRDKGRPADP